MILAEQDAGDFYFDIQSDICFLCLVTECHRIDRIVTVSGKRFVGIIIDRYYQNVDI